MDAKFSELCYEAWRSGRNPDMVSEDAYDHLLDCGYEPDEINLDDIYPSKSKDSRQEDFMEDECPF